jgi:protein-tyrosine phosphatase
VRAADPPEPVFTVLFVCTGNICRSALAERLARARLDEALGERAGLVQVMSAGTDAVVGSGLHPHSAQVLESFGGNPRDFGARSLDAGLAASADLILTMTTRHRAAVLHLLPRKLRRTFTLSEAASLIRLLDDAQPTDIEPTDRMRTLVRLMAEARAGQSSATAEDVPDPYGRALETHQKVGEAISEALRVVLDRIVGLA